MRRGLKQRWASQPSSAISSRRAFACSSTSSVARIQFMKLSVKKRAGITQRTARQMKPQGIGASVPAGARRTSLRTRSGERRA